jgi:hypothetical protein
MDLMHSSLQPGGVLLTNRRGLAYLRPTSIAELRSLCPEWRTHEKGNVVALYAGHADLRTRLASFLNNAMRSRR